MGTYGSGERTFANYPYIVTTEGLDSYSTGVYLNNQLQAILQDGNTVTFHELSGPNKISVQPIIDVSSNIRMYCRDNNITVFSSGNHTFEYKKQYYLNISIGPQSSSEPDGSGWYDVDSNVSIGLSKTVVTDKQNARRIFIGWTGDAKGLSPEITITMNAPKKIIANWKYQYLVIYYIEPWSRIRSEVWFDKGEMLRLIANHTLYDDVFRDYVFDHWEVNGTGWWSFWYDYIEMEINSPQRIKPVYYVEVNVIRTSLILLIASLILFILTYVSSNSALKKMIRSIHPSHALEPRASDNRE